jgi:hypothetical protein
MKLSDKCLNLSCTEPSRTFTTDFGCTSFATISRFSRWYKIIKWGSLGRISGGANGLGGRAKKRASGWFHETIWHNTDRKWMFFSWARGRLLKCISELPSPFYQFGLLVALASAWSLTWYQSSGSRVRVLVFAIYCKNYGCPRLCPCVDFLFSRHTWVGVLKCISELPSPFHQFGLLVALASAWSLTATTHLASMKLRHCWMVSRNSLLLDAVIAFSGGSMRAARCTYLLGEKRRPWWRPKHLPLLLNTRSHIQFECKCHHSDVGRASCQTPCRHHGIQFKGGKWPLW